MEDLGGKMEEGVSRQYSLANPSAKRLKELSGYLRAGSDISVKTVEVLEALAGMSPPERLVFNLAGVLAMLQEGEIENVLKDGLSNDEREVLLEAQLKGVPVGFLECIHGLFNVHERWVLKRALGKAFKDAREAKSRFWVYESPKALDSILGDENG